MVKMCHVCNLKKPETEFVRRRNSRGEFYYTTKCKECNSAIAKKWRSENPERVKELHKTWAENNRERFNEINHARYIKKAYGMTVKERDALLASQNSACAICQTPLEGRGHLTHTDHDHNTGLIRGILCTNCNRGLGHFQDSASLLRKAAEYLEKSMSKDRGGIEVETL